MILQRRKILSKRISVIKVPICNREAYVNAITEDSVFSTMLRDSLIPNSKFSTDILIKEWWKKTFTSPLPINLVRNDIVIILRYELLYRGYTNNNLIVPEKILNNYKASKLIALNKKDAISKFSALGRVLFTCEAVGNTLMNKTLANNTVVPVLKTLQRVK